MTHKNDWEGRLKDLPINIGSLSEVGRETSMEKLESFIRAEIQKAVLAERERIDGVLEGIKVGQQHHSTHLPCEQCDLLLLSQAQEKIREGTN